MNEIRLKEGCNVGSLKSNKWISMVLVGWNNCTPNDVDPCCSLHVIILPYY